jgi:hypothetical protein
MSLFGDYFNDGTFTHTQNTPDEGCSEIEVVENGCILVSSPSVKVATAKPQLPVPIPTSPRSSMDCTQQQQQHPDELQSVEYDVDSTLFHPPRFHRPEYALMDSTVDEDEEMNFEAEEGVEVPFQLLSILDTFLYGCAGCDPCANTISTVNKPRPGILKKRNNNSGHKSFAVEPLNKRTVSFSQLDIKEFKMSLGDHPCSSTGPPVMLDWNSQPTLERVVSLDEYERLRSPRRERHKLRLTYRERKRVLEDQQGFTSEEVNQAWAEAIKIRQQRHETLKRSPLQNTLDDVYESWQRKCHRAAEAVGMAS